MAQHTAGDDAGDAGSSALPKSLIGASSQPISTATPCIARTHHFENLRIGDNARAHLGDEYHYGGQHNHYYTSSADGSSTAASGVPGVTPKQLLDSLSFPQMGFRYAAIQPAYHQTCQWLFETSEYIRWRNRGLRQAHHGLLWVKGKPGSGKSTIMKYALEHAMTMYPEERSLYFFFNGRGDNLEKSVEGMFRALLHQIALDVPWLVTAVNAQDAKAYGKGGWPLDLLKNLFREAIRQLGGTSQVTCYVDALDEGNNEDLVRDMVSFLEDIAESAVAGNANFSVYLTSRHYPNISVAHSEVLVLDDDERHHRDIADFVRSKLNCKQENLREELVAAITIRSAGVFLWVVLTVKILNKKYDHGNHHHHLRSQLRAIPKDLEDLSGT